MASALPPEKLAELKQIIHNQLVQANIQTQIKDVLAGSFNQERAGHDRTEISEGDIMEDLKRKGVVEEILQRLRYESPIIAARTKPSIHKNLDEELIQAELKNKVAVDPTRRYIFIQILGGKAFIDHLNAPKYPGVSGDSTRPCATFTLHLLFRGQRFRSRPVQVACEPDLSEGFLLELHTHFAGEGGRMADTETMLSICDPIHLILTRTDPDGTISLVGTDSLEWRKVLSTPQGSHKVSIELMGVGAESKIPAGILEAKLEVVPRENRVSLTKEVVDAQCQLERRRSAEKERLFLVYAKQWWREYLQIREEHQTRTVKIFAQDETGLNRPVCSFVKPLRAGRLLHTPRQAARFVSTLGYERAPTVGSGGNVEQWRSSHAFFALGKGDHEDHSNLLCSLLLGFGLDAYVCVGSKNRGGAYTWVVTRYSEGATVIFWDAVTGHRYIHRMVAPDDPPAVKQPVTNHPYKSIGCIYNHEAFYANSQPSDIVETCNFNLANSSQWKPMSFEAVKSVCAQSSSFPPVAPLLSPTLDPALVSSQMETELRMLVAEHRLDLELSTCWDDHLCYILSPALAAYESERASGGEPPASGNEEFQEAVRRAVPDGHTFKGFPIQFLHRNARRAFATCLKNQVCSEILGCRGDSVRLAVRVQVFVFPEDAVATWVMFACKYKSVL
uniref:centrosomal protein of 76 kDa-like n=1 Tax=Styela clava TaxID=7725 RepID=UPI00193A42AB|nr:centrosomal protein of 76 kDa-like [Styela clava]XP_039267474.1 centrosomal protein of 76 kDa-like [Styela clava]